jgi:hypothetical protein
MASATRLATDNYNLQVELTLQRHASQFMLSQMHEQQLQLMAKEEELEVSVRLGTGLGWEVMACCKWSDAGMGGAMGSRSVSILETVVSVHLRRFTALSLHLYRRCARRRIGPQLPSRPRPACAL